MTSAETLAMLAHDNVVWVREAVVRNEKTPNEALALLSKDEDRNVRITANKMLNARKEKSKTNNVFEL